MRPIDGFAYRTATRFSKTCLKRVADNLCVTEI
jgi:hypothetical protein